MGSNPESTNKALFMTHIINHTQNVSGFQRAAPDPIRGVI